MLKFGQKEVTTKDFYKQRQITDLFTIDINKVVVSDKVLCNNAKDCCYIVGYHYIVGYIVVDEELIPLFIKTATDTFSYGVSNTIKSLPIQYNLMSLKKKHGRLNIERFGMRLSCSYLKK